MLSLSVTFLILSKDFAVPQIIACKNKNEIILATDSKIVEIDPEGNLSQYIHPFRLYLLRTKKKLPQIDVDEIATAYAVPRLITLKHRLTQQYNANKPLKEILPIIQEALTK